VDVAEDAVDAVVDVAEDAVDAITDPDTWNPSKW
jgi:hypothetical protein